MRTVGVVVKHSSAEAVDLGRQLVVELERLGLDGLLDGESAAAVNGGSGPTRAELPAMVELVVVLGGDGTLLSVAHGELGQTPILGINMGSLGFLTEHPSENLFPLLHATLDGGAVLERRERLEVTVHSPSRAPIQRRALNDAVVNKSALARMVQLSIHVDEQFVSRFRADGLIVATPTGSTAYNLSAGGPVLYPTLENLVITPICPHTLTNRPIVLSMDSVVEVRLEGHVEEVFLTLDGQEGFPLTDHDLVRVRRCPDPIYLVTDPSRSYFQVLHRKLKWGERNG